MIVFKTKVKILISASSSNSSLSILKYFSKILVKIVLANWISYGHFI